MADDVVRAVGIGVQHIPEIREHTVLVAQRPCDKVICCGHEIAAVRPIDIQVFVALRKERGLDVGGKIRAVIDVKVGKQHHIHIIECRTTFLKVLQAAGPGVHNHLGLAIQANEVAGGCLVVPRDQFWPAGA